jgi:predicted amidophosphoribosyltransferase
MSGPISKLRICRGCGCHDLHACPGGCSWVLFDVDIPSGICSACAQDFNWHPRAMMEALCEAAAEALSRWGYA